MNKYHFEKWETGNAYNHKLLDIVISAETEKEAWAEANKHADRYNTVKLKKIEINAPTQPNKGGKEK